MLHFFRKHQKIFFAVVFVIIVMTFVFYGAYQAILSPPGARGKGADETALVDLSGKKVGLSYLNQMIHFLNKEPFLPAKNFADYNFLNEGVISSHFLESGIGVQVVRAFNAQIEPELEAKREREKNYHPYVHPHSPTLSAEGVWSLLAPEIFHNLMQLKVQPDMRARIALFLAQRDFPPALLAQVIRYQEKGNASLAHDPRLSPDHLALFGYKDLTDWFGPAFVRAAAEVIIQTASMARVEGYHVSKEEIYAEVLAKSEQAFTQLKAKMDLPIASGEEFFRVYLRENGYAEEQFIKMWEDILLFKRLLTEVSNGVIGDLVAWDAFYQYAKEGVKLELYQLPPELRFKTVHDLALCETYLEAVGEARAHVLDIPRVARSVEEIEKVAPELVARKYLLEVHEIRKSALQGKVGTKEMWQWQCSDEGWTALKKRVPILGQQEGTPFEILERLDPETRQMLDTFSREKIVDAHPEWIGEALALAPSTVKEVYLSKKGKSPFVGIASIDDFMAAVEGNDELSPYTQDGVHYYTVKVKVRPVAPEVLSFEKAKEVLPAIVQRQGGEVLAERVVAALAAQLNLSKEVAVAHRLDALLKDGAPSALWKAEKREVSLNREELSFISLEGALASAEGVLTPVFVDPVEGAYCYRVIGRTQDVKVPLDQALATQEFLTQEACKCFMDKVITQIVGLR